MASVVIGDVLARLSLDPKRFSAGLKTAEQRLNRTGQRLSDIGSRMSIGLTAPLGAAAAITTKFATTFDTEMTKIITLVGVAEKQVDGWRKDLVAMAGEVGRGPNELARALFVVTSAGERTGNALTILESAAQASAMGLGDTAVIARSVTAALRAYASQNLSAQRAVEILVATVREGNLEASQLAGTLGRVIGVASQVGISFAQVGGFIATFTRLGVDAAEAVVALRGIMSTLLKPSSQAKEALASVGMSMDGLRESIKEKGLAAALVDLVGRFKGNEEGLARLIPNVRALAGVLGTAGVQAKSFASIQENIENSQGILAEGFQRTGKTIGHAFEVFKAEAEAAAIAIGEQLAPSLQRALAAARPIAAVVVELAEAFGKLPGPIQTTVIALGALAIVAGPVAFVLGNLIRISAWLAGALSYLIPQLAGMRVATAAAIAVAALAGSVAAFSGEAKGIEKGVKGVKAASGTVKTSAGEATRAVDTMTAALEGPFSFALDAAIRKTDSLRRAVRALNKEAELPPPVPMPTGGIAEPQFRVTASAAPTRATPTPSLKPVRLPVQVDVGSLTKEQVLLERVKVRISEIDARDAWEKELSKLPLGSLTGLGGALSQEAPPGQLDQLREGSHIALVTPDPDDAINIFNRVDKEIEGLKRAAELLPDTFDLGAAKADALADALREAAEVEGFDVASVAAQRLVKQLAAATVEGTQLDADLARIQQRAGEPGFDVMAESVGRVTDEMEELRSRGIAETHPRMVQLKGIQADLIGQGPDLTRQLAGIGAAGELLGAQFDTTRRSTDLITGALEELAIESGGRLTPGMERLSELLKETASDTSNFESRLKEAAATVRVFEGGEAAARIQLQLLRAQLEFMIPILGTNSKAVEDLRLRYLGLKKALDDARDSSGALQVELAGIELKGDLLDLDPQEIVGDKLAAVRSAFDAELAKLNLNQAELGRADAFGPPDPTRSAELSEDIGEGKGRLLDLSGDIDQLDQLETKMGAVEGLMSSVADNISSAFEQSVIGIIRGTTSIGEAFANLGINIGLSWASSMVNLVTKHAAARASSYLIELLFGEKLVALTEGTAATVAGIHTALETQKTVTTAAGEATRTAMMWKTVWDGLKGAWTTATGWITSAIASAAAWVVAKAVMGAAFLATAAKGVASALSTAWGWIASAAAGAASAMASIPYVGPALAIAAALAIVGGLTALVLSIAEKGAVLDKDQLVYAHKDEMILPAHLSKGVQRFINDGGGVGAVGVPNEDALVAVAQKRELTLPSNLDKGIQGLIDDGPPAAAKGALLEEDQFIFGHKREMILPAHLARGVEDLIANGEGAPILTLPELPESARQLADRDETGRSLRARREGPAGADDAELPTGESLTFNFNVNAIDGQSVGRHLRRHGREYASNMARQYRSFSEAIPR